MAETATRKPLNALPLKHRLFILGYIEHKGDKTKAAREAGYSAKTADVIGGQLFGKLRDYITPMTKEVVAAYALSANQVVQGLSLLASSDIGDYLSWDAKKVTVTLKDFASLTPAQRFCIESVKHKTSQWGDTIELRLAKKQPALDTLALYHNLLKRPTAAKGLFVSFEDGTVHGGNKATREVLAHTRRPVEVTFEDAEPGPGKKGNGHG